MQDKSEKKKDVEKQLCSCFYLWAGIGLPDVELTFPYTKTIYIPWYSVLKFELMTFDKAIMNVLL